MTRVIEKGKRLLGIPFIGEYETCYNPIKRTEEDLDRICQVCGFRTFNGPEVSDCLLDEDSIFGEEKTPKEIFGYEDGYLPTEINGEPVGNFCRKFKPFFSKYCSMI